MIVDALLEADKALHFSDKIHSAKEFITLDDSVLKAIENFSLYNPGCGVSTTCCTEKSVHVTPMFKRPVSSVCSSILDAQEYACIGQRRFCDVHEGAIRSAQAIIDRLRRRDLYRFVQVHGVLCPAAAAAVADLHRCMQPAPLHAASVEWCATLIVQSAGGHHSARTTGAWTLGDA